MLLRQAEPADVDGYISAAAAMSSPREQQPRDDDTTTAPRTDPLDDVFGSDGGDDDDTPAFEHDDDYEAGPHIIRAAAAGPSSSAAHPSDMHRLRQEHTTSGYREGVTAAKGASIQAGFDEGFGLGATIGLRVGHLLGVLEGVAAALGSRDPAAAPFAAERAQAAGRLLAEARAGLGVQAVFSPEYWDSDGTWKYEVGGRGAEEEEGEEEVVFSHVAEAHPLVRKWALVVEEQMRRWGLEQQLPLLQRRDDEDAAGAEPVAKGVKAVAPAQPGAKVGNDALSW